MHKLSQLLQADPFDAALVQARLEELGLGESAADKNPLARSPSAKIPKNTALKSFSGQKSVGGSSQTGSVRGVVAKSRTAIPNAAMPPVSTARAEKLIDGLAATPQERIALFRILDDLMEEMGRAADPLRALLNFARLAEAVGDRTAFYNQLRSSPAILSRLCRLLSFSQALADTLVRQPELLDLMRLPAQPSARAALRKEARAALQSGTTGEAQLEALRRFRRRETVRIGLLDMERQTWRNVEDFELVVRQISDLAQVCIEQTLRIVARESGIAKKNSAVTGFAVIAMGKLGARELNYSSDIDLIFVSDGDTATMQKLGERLLKELTASTIEGTLYRVDMRLRPEGKSGPLVTSLSYALGYYETYAAAWEWQALIKARGMAGDARLARRFRKFTRGVTWAKRSDDAHLRSMLEMKQRSEATPGGTDGNNVKEGPGAIRDAEWIVQQLQMMVGPQHPIARVADTLHALAALRALDAMTHEEAAALREGYLFLRTLEHRLQLLDERAVRVIPGDEGEQTALARRLGCTWRGAAATRWLAEEHERHRKDIRALCERMFWGWRETAPSLAESTDNFLRVDALNGHLSSEPTRQRLQRLTQGTPTQPLPPALARQVTVALPDVLQYLEHAANPEHALANLERLCDASGNRLSLLRALGDAPHLARAVFAILGGSEFLSDTLIHFPELLDMVAQRSLLEEAKSWEQARADCRAYCFTFRDRKAALRRWKRREMLRIGLRDLALNAPPHEITAEISDLAHACLTLACDEVQDALRPASERIGFAVLGMGKLGGGEMHYASDADVLFTYEVRAAFKGAQALAIHWAEDLTQYMGEHTAEGMCFAVDARLRPEGRNGLLVPAVDGYLDYFERATGGIAIWERQALTRARFVAGDAETAARLLAATRHVAFPEVWQPAWSEELRHIKSRVEHERSARGSATGQVFDVKLGPGGLSDIEWCAQWIAMRHGAQVQALQTPNTLQQIAAACDAEVLAPTEGQALQDAYSFLRRAELRLQITQDHALHGVKRGSNEFRSWARAVFPTQSDEAATSLFEEQWRQHTTAVRAVMERVRDTL